MADKKQHSKSDLCAGFLVASTQCYINVGGSGVGVMARLGKDMLTMV